MKYIVFTNDTLIDDNSVQQLEILRQSIESGKSNDIAKYNLPESFRTKLQIQMNLRSFLHFHKLRSDKSAHFEIRELANVMLGSLPAEIQNLLKD